MADSRQPFKILFRIPDSALPRPLPSPEDVESSQRIFQDYETRKTVLVSESFVVKYGSEVLPSEGEDMRWIQKHSHVRIPTVFATYQKHNHLGVLCTFIVMEYIAGSTLQSLWPTLSKDEKSGIATKLRKQFNELRSLPSPGYFGGIQRKKLQDGLFWTKAEIRSINGPFETEDELLEAIVKQYINNGGGRVNNQAEFYRRILPHVLRDGGDSVLTHDDLQPKNIIVQENGSVVILDWATVGWYPRYWEYAMAMFALGHWEDDWYAYLPEILDEYPNQYVWFSKLRVEMWG